MKKYLLVTDKPWHDGLEANLRATNPNDWHRIIRKEDFTADALQTLKPDWVFIPHWSHLIPASIYENYRCVVFHMTDLPYGRGGSPLQNLIVRGHTNTKLTAIRVGKGLDTGDIYLQEDLDLSGSAEEIFVRASGLMQQMIRQMIATSPSPRPQVGEVVEFKRRSPQDGNIAELQSVKEVYDYIRMLDAPGYPPAFAELKNWKFEFNQASLESDGTLKAHVRITKK